MSDSTQTLGGKTVLVTGSGRGLGRAFAERLAALGANVGMHGMREHGPAEYGEGTTLTDTAEQVAQQFSVKTVRVLGDLTLTDDVQLVVKTVEEELGPIDILVHNAGGDIAADANLTDARYRLHERIWVTAMVNIPLGWLHQNDSPLCQVVAVAIELASVGAKGLFRRNDSRVVDIQDPATLG
ncbi:MAG: SDR family NAD(P)-dependent oxidoreductase [Proteobacteria bacterium]|nr:SDR family NAD(P)-dependent oxidoreductase [Pseudomonadota bacterium]